MPVQIEALPYGLSRFSPLQSSAIDEIWIPTATAPVCFPLEIFMQVCNELVLHPERNSSSILRCDVVQDVNYPNLANTFHPDYTCTRRLRRKILPRRPFDSAMDQDCFFLNAKKGGDAGAKGMLLLIPLLSERNEDSIPFYHPKVAGIAFRYFPSSSADSAGGDIVLDYLPFETCRDTVNDIPYWPEDSRTYRTALALLATLVKVGKGFLPEHKYAKRVHHDSIVPREDFQDLYLALKDRHSHIFDKWVENTDPKKHVFEDIAIATFLICLWRDIYRDTAARPPGGFVDVGCGNGLLVHLLHQEGYAGYGIDLRARKSWEVWGSKTPLRVATLLPAEMCLLDEPPFPAGSFLIGNHADELTPWLPLLAARIPGSAFINIPCCMHTFTDKFTKREHRFSAQLYSQHSGIQTDMQRFDRLSSENGGRYNAYLQYIAELTVQSGWRPEREALRIPSTKNWAFIGRKRIWPADSPNEAKVQDWVSNIAQSSLEKWRPRQSEGKDH